MTRSIRCACVIWLAIGLLVYCQMGPVRPQGGDPRGQGSGVRFQGGDQSEPGPAEPQDPRDDADVRDPTLAAWAGSLPTDPALARQLEAAHDYVKEEAWIEATSLLQAFLDTKEDVLTSRRRSSADSRDAPRWTGLRLEANRLLGQLSPQGRELYETLRGPQARALLTEAIQKTDLTLLAEVAQRYFHTAAGAEATRRLGVAHLDRGRFELAALCFGRLLERVGAEQVPPATLVASVLALRLAGNEGRAAQVWNRLAAQAPAGVRLDDRLVSLAELEKDLSRLQTALAGLSDRSGLSLFRGGMSRPPQALGSAPLLESQWTQSAVYEALTRQWVQSAMQREEERSEPVLTGAVPMVVGDKVIYRSHWGVHAVERQTGGLVWEAGSEWGLDRMARELRYHPYLASWINGYMVNNAFVLYENSTLGSLSTDGTRVFAVDDLPIPPYPMSFMTTGRRRGPILELSFGPDLTDAAHHSRLLALDADTGKLLWEIGGRGEAAAGLWSDSHFLGPPLPLDGLLFSVLEKNQELRLVCLDAAHGGFLWKQALAVPMNRVVRDVGRRLEALSPAYGDGMLVCATNAGVVLGVDLFHRGLAWAYVYREDVLPQDAELGGWGFRGRYGPRVLPRLRKDWKAAAPVIHGDRVIVTAPDTAAVHCLDLRSGNLLWKADRMDDDVYLAGIFSGKVVIVGKQSCRAVRLADGKPLWKVETGLPSGQGVLAGNVYYLPLKAALPQKRPAVCALDLDQGAILDRIPAPPGEVPGNLVLCGDTVVSQSVLAVTAYPQRKHDKEGGN